MMEEISLVYIDDDPERALEKYLDNEYVNTKCNIKYKEIIFNPSDGYESLIQDVRVQEANIIIIDSRLFENRTATMGKFSGEEFKIVLKKLFPFIEVIVITQNGEDSAVKTISKYDINCRKNANKYYDEVLSPYLDEAIDLILVYRRLAERLQLNDSWEKTLKEKILNALHGIGIYDELTKTDIDQLIIAFKEMQENLNA